MHSPDPQVRARTLGGIYWNEDYLARIVDRLDEKEFSEPYLAQTIYLLKHRKELSKRVEKKVVSARGFILKTSVS